jgi:hypothetical protein
MVLWLSAPPEDQTPSKLCSNSMTLKTQLINKKWNGSSEAPWVPLVRQRLSNLTKLRVLRRQQMTKPRLDRTLLKIVAPGKLWYIGQRPRSMTGSVKGKSLSRWARLNSCRRVTRKVWMIHKLICQLLKAHSDKQKWCTSNRHCKNSCDLFARCSEI